MSIPSWRAAYATAIGSSHEKTGMLCQDAGHCRIIQSFDGSQILLAVASDGAGSASRSDVGSKLAVDSFLLVFGEAVQQSGFADIDRKFVLNWLNGLHAKVLSQAEEEGLQPRDFACTILAAIVGIENATFFQIGDGAIVVSEFGSEDYGCVFWPQHGEFANQTNFLFQDNIEETLEFISRNDGIEKLAIFTDGIERLVLDFTSKSAHIPALRSIFEWLAKCEPSKDESPSFALSAYLSSEYINSRTDDDKTLVMATRAPT